MSPEGRLTFRKREECFAPYYFLYFSKKKSWSWSNRYSDLRAFHNACKLILFKKFDFYIIEWGFVNKSSNQFSIWIMEHIFFTNVIDLRGAQGNPTTTAAVLLFELNSWDLSISVLRVGKNSIIILIFQKEHLRCDKTASLLIVCVMTRMQQEIILLLSEKYYFLYCFKKKTWSWWNRSSDLRAFHNAWKLILSKNSTFI